MEISGVVIEGEKYGRRLGRPTANIDRNEYQQKNLHILYGIYAGCVLRADGTLYKAGIVVGPEDSQGLPRLEAHLIDFDGDLYGERVTFYLLKYLRPFKQYDTEDILKNEINKDIAVIREMDLCLPESLK